MYRYKAMVLRVIDGDTIKVAIDLGFNMIRQTRIRLAGIDCVELKDKNNLEKALAAKKYTEDRLLNKEVMLKSLKPGKYHDRYIAFIYLDGEKESFNDKMVKDGYASPYKKSPRKKEKS